MTTEQPTSTDASRWHTPEHARHWIERMDREGQGRQDELRTLVSLLSFDPQASLHVLELGAGHGLLTAVVLDHFPHARVLALDLSPTMITEGQQRLAAFGDRVAFCQWDLSQPGLPPQADGPFDAVVSSLALHHLQRPRKAQLAQELAARLRPGGFFLNLDYVSAATESLTARYQAAQAALGSDGHGHARGSHVHDPLEPQLEDLRRAGFADVEVFWKNLHLTLLGGTRP